MLFLRPHQVFREAVLALPSTVDGFGLYGYTAAVSRVMRGWLPSFVRFLIATSFASGIVLLVVKAQQRTHLRTCHGTSPLVVDQWESVVSPARSLQFPSTCPGGFQGVCISYSPTLSLTIYTAVIKSMLPRWHLGSLTVGPMYPEAGTAFWSSAALKDLPKLPYWTDAQTIYHYRTTKAFNTSCWVHFNSILSNRDQSPRLEVVDICPTFRPQRLRSRKKFHVCDATKSPRLPDRRMTRWDVTHQVFLISLRVF